MVTEQPALSFAGLLRQLRADAKLTPGGTEGRIRTTRRQRVNFTSPDPGPIEVYSHHRKLMNPWTIAQNEAYDPFRHRQQGPYA